MPALIQSRIGPPGTGKTTYVQNVVLDSIERFGADRILLTSLTRAAAAVLNKRGLPIPSEAIGTLHAHAYRALARPRLAETPAALKAWNAYTQQHGWTWATRSVPARSGDPDADPIEEQAGESLAEQYQVARAALRPRDTWPLKLRQYAELWEGWKQAEDCYDFNDLLELAAAEVPTAPGAPALIVADEAQDLSPLALQLLNKWGAAAQHFLKVGDPYQGLYGWAGADPEGFRAGVPAEQEAILSQSYRVPAAVHSLAMRWLRTMPGYWPIAYAPTEAAGTVAIHTATWRDPAGLFGLLEREVAAGRTVQVLASCGYMLEPLITLLRERGLAFHNPYRPKHGGWNPLTGAGTRTTDRLLAYLRWDTTAWGPEARAWRQGEIPLWAEWLRAEAFAGRGTKTALINALSDLPPEDGDQEVEIDQLVAWFGDGALDALMHSDLDWYAGRVIPSHLPALRFPLTIARLHGGAALRQVPLITVGTIHSVKGGEADTVILFPDLSQAGQREWADPRGRAGIYRLFYVGMTRARDTLYLCRPAAGGAVPWPTLHGGN